MKSYITEAIGTFFLVLTVGVCVTEGVPGTPIAIGFALMVMVYAGGSISGGHYNPAVSLAAWIRGALPSRELVPYWAAQFIGGIVAAFLAYKFAGHPLHVAPAENTTWLKGVVGEGIYTFALCYVVLHTATVKATEGNSYFGLAIGATLMIGVFALGEITGGAFNPAVGLSPIVTELIAGGTPSSLAWIYLVGPFAGGAAAAYAFKIQRPGV